MRVARGEDGPSEPNHHAESQRRSHVAKARNRGGSRGALDRPLPLAAEDDDRRPVIGHHRVQYTNCGDGRDQHGSVFVKGRHANEVFAYSP